MKLFRIKLKDLTVSKMFYNKHKPLKWYTCFHLVHDQQKM